MRTDLATPGGRDQHEPDMSRYGDSLMQFGLFSQCAAPTCQAPVAQSGDVCDGCRVVFGDMLRKRPATDIDVPDAQAEESSISLHPRMAGPGIEGKASAELDTKANQICWLCQDRRICAQVDGRWECRVCRDVDGADEAPGQRTDHSGR